LNWLQQRIAKAKDEQGFTLIELLIVIIILGILAAVVIFAIGAVTDKGQLASCRTDAKTLRTAEEAEFNKNNIYKDGPGLVTDKVLAEDSELHTLAPSGTPVGSEYTIQAKAGSKCVSLATAAGGGTCVAPAKCYTP
jgi:general secretion pathway protein G